MNAAGPNPKQPPPKGGLGPTLVFGSVALVAFVASWERDPRRPTVVYADKIAKSTRYPGGLPTVCSGLTPYITTTPMLVGEDWGAAKCDREEAAALAKVQHALRHCFVYAPPQSVFDAATSHAWNLGVTATCGSSAMRAWNAQQWKTGCERLQLSADGRAIWSYAGGKFIQGLANRRAAERQLCEAGL